MGKCHDLAQLEWELCGWVPYFWQFERALEEGGSGTPAVPFVQARVPGSVQQALREARVLPDWNVGLQSRECEWVENLHWVFRARIPDEWTEDLKRARLRCEGLDYSGWVLVSGEEAGRFRGTFVPHVFDLSGALRPRGNVLHIVFDCPPRWLGQCGRTSEMTEWKPRFNYGWDWTSRLVQIGIWDGIYLEEAGEAQFEGLRCRAGSDAAEGGGEVRVTGSVAGEGGEAVVVSLARGETVIAEERTSAAEFCAKGTTIRAKDISPWWPNMMGEQALYEVRCMLRDGNGRPLDEDRFRVGFRSVQWERCEGAAKEADPWLCVVNGRPVFLQGVNWTPIRPNFADVDAAAYRKRLAAYRDMGCNILRVWGGGYLEKECFYDLCDEMGIMVWQEFPLSSSGIANEPPGDDASVDALEEIARSYVARRGHHASLIVWSGGNELTFEELRPITTDHPMIRRFQTIVRAEDGERRFLPSSPSGPRFLGEAADYGKGVHWDVHGPWRPEAGKEYPEGWRRYWEGDDALFRSEVGFPGASPATLVRRYKGGLSELPATAENPLWARTSWWVDWDDLIREKGREPANYEEYVRWSQERQAEALSVAARACKGRFPRCGGFIIWMGHDSFPCTANTAVIDFEGEPKPAAMAVREIFRTAPSDAHL